MNQLDIQHSLRTYFAAKHDMEVVWIYDGVKLPTAKPFMTIEQMQNNTSVLSKMRDAVQTLYRFQVGLQAVSASQRAQLQEQIHRGLLFDKIPLLDASNPSSPASGFFVVEGDISVTPISAEDVSDKTQYHKVYFDVTVRATFNAKTTQGGK